MSDFTHPDARAHVAGILANPADDLCRLVFADWLDENDRKVACIACRGQSGNYGTCRDCWGSGRAKYGSAERAEFIRVQVAEAKAKGRRKKKLADRAAALLRGPKPDIYENEVVWFNDGTGTDTWKLLFKPVWRRGFVAEVTCTLGHWSGERPSNANAIRGGRGQGPAIVACQPVENVVVTDKRTATGPDGERCFTSLMTGQNELLHLPHVLPGCLPLDWRPHGVGRIALFDDDALASDALSASLIAWAKSTPPSPLP